MMAFLRRHYKACVIATCVIFLLSCFVGLGGYLFTSRDMGGAVASVGKDKIPYSVFSARVNQYADAVRAKGGDVSDDMLKQIKQGMLRDMIVDDLLTQKADQMGIQVTDAELARDIQNTPLFQSNGQFNQQLYYNALQSVYQQTPETYEAQRRDQIKAAKFKQLVYQTAKLTPDELKEEYAQVHKGSMKNFDKDKDSFAAQAQQQRAIDLINYYLRQLTTQVEIHTYLQERESGA